MRRVTATIIMIAFAAGCAEALAAEITLRDSATVGRSYVRMGDIVTVSGFDAATTEKINAIFCGSSPKPQQTRTIDVAYIKMRLLQNDIAPVGVKFSGAKEVAVSSAAVVVVNWPDDPKAEHVDAAAPQTVKAPTLKEKYLQLIRKQLSEAEAVNPADLSIEIGNVSNALKAAPSASEIEAFKQVGSRGTSSTAIFHAKLVDADKKAYEGIVMARVKLIVQVVALKRDMKSGEKITADDVEVVRMPLTGARSRYFGAVNEVLGHVLEADLRKGEALTTNRTELPVAVKKGDTVKLISRIAGKNISVETTAIIMVNGKIGETIKVKNTASGKELMARVVDGKTVEVIVGETK